MPYIYKQKSKSNNSSRSSNASSQGKPVLEEDDFGSIKIKTPSSKKTTPKQEKREKTPEVVETPPAPVLSPWDILKMTQEEYEGMMERLQQQRVESMKQSYQDFLLAEMETPSYWKRRIETLESHRAYYNKKRGWSALDILEVEQIDVQLQECQDELERLDALEDE